MDVDGRGSKWVFHRLDGQQFNPSKNQEVCYHWRASNCNQHPCPFLHRELPAPSSQQGLNGTASTKRHHSFTANTNGPSSRNRCLNSFNGGASSTWGVGKEIVVRICMLRARDDEFDLGFHKLSPYDNEWSSLNSTLVINSHSVIPYIFSLHQVPDSTR